MTTFNFNAHLISLLELSEKRKKKEKGKKIRKKWIIEKKKNELPIYRKKHKQFKTHTNLTR